MRIEQKQSSRKKLAVRGYVTARSLNGPNRIGFTIPMGGKIDENFNVRPAARSAARDTAPDSSPIFRQIGTQRVMSVNLPSGGTRTLETIPAGLSRPSEILGESSIARICFFVHFRSVELSFKMGARVF